MIKIAEQLQNKETVKFRPRGNSMKGRIESGQLVTIIPTKEIYVDDIVFCKVNGHFYVHLVKAVEGDRYLIGNNRGGTNGWTRQVYGKVIRIED